MTLTTFDPITNEQFLIISLFIGSYVFSTGIDFLNLKSATLIVPAEFKNEYDADKYKKAQQYLKSHTHFSWIENLLGLLVMISFLLLGGFNLLDQTIRQTVTGEIPRGLLFIGCLAFASWFLNLPFAIYSTFVIEEKYGFNKMNFKTFLGDQAKALLLGALLGSAVLSLIIWFFKDFQNAWVLAWVFIVAFQLFMMFIAPVTIMPLFNKFTPLEDSPLKTKIEAFAVKENFKLAGLFKMDGSKRSTKANAYFTGFGKFRRIVLFDTLISKNTDEELVSILAHEIGHYKLKHIFRQLAVSILTMGFTLFIFSLFLKNEFIFKAFGVTELSIYGSLVFFSFFYSPLSSLISIYSLHLSRKYEFEADAYAVRTYGHPHSLISALKKLSVDNLSNLTPHPLKVFLEYTHPPILRRIQELRSQAKD